MIPTFATRLKMAMALRGMKQVDLARRVSITQSAISQWFNSTRVPKPLTIRAISQVLHVSTLWLETGEGKMELPDDRFAEAMEGLSSSKKEFIRLVLAMPDELSEQLLPFLKQQFHSD